METVTKFTPYGNYGYIRQTPPPEVQTRLQMKINIFFLLSTISRSLVKTIIGRIMAKTEKTGQSETCGIFFAVPIYFFVLLVYPETTPETGGLMEVFTQTE